MSIKYGENIKKARLDANLSQKQLADKINVSTSTIRKYECDERTPRDDKKVKMAELFNCSVAELFWSD